MTSTPTAPAASSQLTPPPASPTPPLPREPKRSPLANSVKEGMGAKARNRLGNWIVGTLLTIGSVVMIAPLLWTFSTSLKTREAVFALPPQWIPDPVVWENYVRIWTAGPLLSGIQNSLIVSLSVTIVGSFFSTLAAYAFAKMRMPFKEPIFLMMLAALMIPFPTLMIPQFMMFASWGWYDTLLPLIVPGLFGNIIMMFFLRQYLGSVPDSMIEAAKLDGASHFQIYWRLVVPIIRPAIAAQFILWFMFVWNDYLAPIIYLNTPERQTLQLVIANFNANYIAQTDYPLIMAASFVALLPVLVVFFFFQRQIIESVALTGSKG